MQQIKINNKPCFWVKTHPLNINSGFVHKRLCDGMTFSPGTSCAYSCTYCYVPSMVLKQAGVRTILGDQYRFNQVVIRRENVISNLALDLTRKKRKNEEVDSADTLLQDAFINRWNLKDDWSLDGRVLKFKGAKWDGKVIFGSPIVDVAPTKELAEETVELCEMILRLTDLHIRLLSKSPLVAKIAEELDKRLPDPTTGAKARVIFGLSTGTLDDKVAAAVEPHTPSPSARLKALHWLQDNGFRTYGMLCPILPHSNAKEYARAAMEAIRAERCEEIWAEVLNCRHAARAKDGEQQHDSFTATLKALTDGGFDEEAKRFKLVAEDGEAWEKYSRQLFEALVEAAPQQTIERLVVGEKARAERPNKLWWLHYPRNAASLRDYWEKQQVNGAVLLGAVVSRARKPKVAKREKQIEQTGQVAA